MKAREDEPGERRSRALALHKAGALPEAERLYRRILEDEPADGETWHLLAVLMGQSERHAEALAACREAVRHGCRRASVYANLANAHRHLGDEDSAVEALAAAVEIDPHDADIALELIESLLDTGAEGEALKRLTEATARFPADARFHTELGGLAARLNDGERAEAEFRRAAELDDSSAVAALDLGNVLQMRGRRSAAEAACRRALALDPRLDACYWHLVQLRKIAPDETLAKTVLKLAAAGPASASAEILFAAGKVHDDAGRFDRAFESFRAGNALVRRRYEYRIEDELQRIDALRDSLAAASARPPEPPFEARLETPLASPETPPRDAPQPIFIVGMPRSGSTLLEQMLARHPGIAAGGEIVWLQRYLADALSKRRLRFPEDQNRLPDEALAGIRERYFRALILRARGAGLVTDKLPANFLCIPAIRRMFPHATVINVRRDPVETCWSCYRHLFSGPQRFAYDLGELGLYHDACIAFVDACRERWPERVAIVSYERLVVEPEAELRPLLDAAGLEWDAACLTPERSDDLLMTASSLQIREGLYPAPRRAAERYSEYLGPLLVALGRAGGDR